MILRVSDDSQKTAQIIKDDFFAAIPLTPEPPRGDVRHISLFISSVNHSYGEYFVSEKNCGIR
ncbi:hypothetical protein ACLB1Q_02120 [Escherichia coli]